VRFKGEKEKKSRIGRGIMGRRLGGIEMNRPSLLALALGFLLMILQMGYSAGPPPMDYGFGDPYNQGRLFERLLHAKKGRLEDYISGEDTALALAAAWRRAKEARGSRAAKRAEAVRFLGFVEGRFRTRIPKDWTELVLRELLEGFDKEDIAAVPFWPGKSIKGGRADYPWREVPRNSLKLRYAHKPLRVVVGKETTTITAGKGRVSVPTRALAKLAKHFGRLSRGLNVAITKNSIFLAIGSTSIGAGGTLARYDREKKAIVWTQELWELGLFGGFSGPWVYEFVVVPGDKEVAVFGHGSGGFCIETFDAEKGKPTCRFASSFWEGSGIQPLEK
jgi:hypothetical protein